MFIANAPKSFNYQSLVKAFKTHIQRCLTQLFLSVNRKVLVVKHNRVHVRNLVK